MIDANYLQGAEDAIKVLQDAARINKNKGTRNIAAEFERSATVLKNWLARRRAEVAGPRLQIHQGGRHRHKAELREVASESADQVESDQLLDTLGHNSDH